MFYGFFIKRMSDHRLFSLSGPSHNIEITDILENTIFESTTYQRLCGSR